MSIACKVESGLQLIARLSKKRDVEKFYPILFESGPKPGEVVEIFGECGAGKSFLLMNLIVQALLPATLGGAETEVLIYHTDGNMNAQHLLNIVKQAVQRRSKDNFEVSLKNKDIIFQECCNRLHIIEIYDATQLHVTIHNLENIFIIHPNISLLVFDTLTAYYWSEQEIKLSKMDLYLKSLIKLIQKATKDYKSTIVYTRQEYFNSSKEGIKNLEACSKLPILECLNYRIHISFDELNHQVIVTNYNSIVKKTFRINNCQLEWI